ncbi:MAG: cell division protein FtsW, partial [Halanaerobium sp. MSAO_Bac5]
MKKKLPDFILLFTILTLVFSGVVMILSASSVRANTLFGDSYYFFKRHLFYLALSSILAVIAYKINYKKIKELAPSILLFSLLTLILVLIPGIGRVVGGSRRWLSIGPFSFQPSEFAKLATVIYLAAYISKNKGKMKKFKSGIIPPVIVISIIFALIILEPDLGTAITIAALAGSMIFIGGIKLGWFLTLSLAASALFMLFIYIEPYRRKRLFSFLNPWQDPLDSGYHIIQSLLALGSGGFLGVGAGNSYQKFLYLPEPGTDFIFAVLGEEFGLIGTLFILSLYFIIVWRGFRI